MSDAVSISRRFWVVCLSAFLCTLYTVGQNRNNPVLHHVADAGVIRYAGQYYLGGVATDGDFFVSSDLMHWDCRIHVFDLDNEWTHGTGARNNQVHADDISYSGGLFHLLFSVNYWGKDRHIVHITHATSPTIEGPFREAREDQWFENRIDPHVFRDEDGRLYLYMVKFTDGNTIWARSMNPDFTFSGEAVQQFSSQPDTWETEDNRVAEGPFVVKYRGKYYMMYNANHTEPSFGHYRLGVCQSDSPLGFGPGGKYSYPVVSPNTEQIEDSHVNLLCYGNGSYCPADLRTDTLTFTLQDASSGPYYLKVCQYGGCQIYLNDYLVNEGHSNDYSLIPIDARILHETNTLRVEHRGTLADLALYRMEDDEVDDLLITPGQPNIVRGPNGWEWWLSYMANTGWSRHQFVDRIHFTRNRLAVDGITGPRTAGFHPTPALPRYAGQHTDSISLSDAFLLELTFCGSRTLRLGREKLTLPSDMDPSVPHEWRIEKNHHLLTVWVDGVLVVDHRSVSIAEGASVRLPQTAQIVYVSYCEGWDEYAQYFSGWGRLEADEYGLLLPATELLRDASASDYAFSVLFTNATPGQGKYGMVAAFTDEENWVKVCVDALHGVLVVDNSEQGRLKTTEYPLDTLQTHYPDIKYSDGIEQQYRFDCLTDVHSILLPRGNVDLPSMASLLQFSWLDGDTWHPLSYTEEPYFHPGWQKITFPTIRTKALRMINADPTSYGRHIYRIKTGRACASDCQIRVEKRDSLLYVYVDDREIACVRNRYIPVARVGLFSDGDSALHVANTLYYPVY